MAKSGTYTLTHGRNASLPTTDDCAIPGFEDNGIAASDYPHTPENSALEESPSGDRKESFRKLLRDVAERLGSSEVEQMELFEDIPEPLKGRSALALLTELWKRGKLSSQMTEPLIRLLRAIHRHDLANTLVVPYCAKYPDEEDCQATQDHLQRGRLSLPVRGSPRIEHGMRIRRINTAESRLSPKIIVESPKHSMDSVTPSSGAIFEQHKPSSFLAPPCFNDPREKERYPHTFSASPHSESEKWSNSNVMPPPTKSSPSRQYMNHPHLHAARSLSVGNTPTHSSFSLTGAENTSEVGQPGSFCSPSSSNIHFHVHLPPNLIPSQSSNALLDELRTSDGENKSIRARLRSAPEQMLKEYHLQAPPDKPTDPPKVYYQHSGEEKSDYSSSDVDSEEQDGSGGKALILKLDTISKKVKRKYKKHKSEMTLRDKSPEEDSTVEKDPDVGPGNIPRAKKVESIATSKPLINGLSVSRNGSSSRRHFFGMSKILFKRKRKSKNELGHQQYISWSVQREEALELVCKHSEQASLRCHQHLPVEAHAEQEHNPYLTFRLFPYGLFEDKGKSMTLFIKIIIPDECPPVHPSAQLYLSVRMCTGVETEQRFPQLETRVNSCVHYIFKLLSHKTLLEMNENELTFKISACTAP